MPITLEEHERSSHHPALCELLPLREYLDNVVVRTNGHFVAGYELVGLNGHYHDDKTRNDTKSALETLVRSLPERAIRMQMRYETREGVDALIDHYRDQMRSRHAIVRELDLERLMLWRERDEAGNYLDRKLRVYFAFDPVEYHRKSGFEVRMSFKEPVDASRFSLSFDKCIERTRREHEALLAEFNSLLSGIETTLASSGLAPRRLSDEEMFREAQEAMNPMLMDPRPYRRYALQQKSVRSQIVTTSIEDEQDDYLKVGGLLYTFVSMRDLPDGTYPGIMRELMTLDFPVVVNVEAVIPDQERIRRTYKLRIRKMEAAQKDFDGNYRRNVEAEEAQRQLQEILRQVVRSSLKVAEVSFIAATRTSEPAHGTRQIEQAQRILADRRQRLMHAISRMDGATPLEEGLAQRRLFIHGLPAMSERNYRENECLTLHAADLLPTEIPWRGTVQTPAFLFETREKFLLPYSPFDPTLENSNMLVIATSGGGKTFVVMQMLISLSRLGMQISIIERGDSYAPLVEIMGGMCLTVDLDGAIALNPWDLPPGESDPSKDKVKFLANLTRHMIGESGRSDATVLDAVLTNAIGRVYARKKLAFENPTPIFSDLVDELTNYRDDEGLEQAMAEARVAAFKLSQWVGEKGIYSNLMDRPTTPGLDADWMYFNIEKLASDSKLETAYSLIIANAIGERASGRTGRPSVTALDECWALLDSPVLATEVVQLFRTARKRNSAVLGISQTLEDFVGTPTEPRLHGAGVLRNAHTKLLGKKPGDPSQLREKLDLNEVVLGHLKGLGAVRKGHQSEMLLISGDSADTTQLVRVLSSPLEYWICTTFGRERNYRTWFLSQRSNQPLIDSYRELAAKFPHGLAEAPPLPEEQTGEVQAAVALRTKQ
ncbi:MAG: hypothetical protein WB676_04780 [Bryobacteraceae bacterium]